MVLTLPYEVFDTPYAKDETPFCDKVLCYSDEGILAFPFLYSHLEVLCFRDDHEVSASTPSLRYPRLPKHGCRQHQLMRVPASTRDWDVALGSVINRSLCLCRVVNAYVIHSNALCRVLRILDMLRLTNALSAVDFALVWTYHHHYC